MGILYPLSKETLDANNAIENMKILVDAARESGVKVIYVPHHHYQEGDKSEWKFGSGSRSRVPSRNLETWSIIPTYRSNLAISKPGNTGNQSGFANTDLDFLLKQHDIDHVILAGMRANTCIESTARYAVELGYHTTMLTDAVGAFNMEELRAAVDIDYPVISHNVLSTKEFVAAID